MSNHMESDSIKEKNINWYTHLPDSEPLFIRLTQIGTTICVPKNHILIKAGTIPECCYMVISGMVTGYEYTPTGDERVYNFDHFNKGGILLLDAHVIANFPVSVTFRTKEPTVLIRITREQLMEEILENPSLSMKIMCSISYKFFSAVEQLRELRCNKVSVIAAKLFLGLANRFGIPYQNMIVISEPFTQQEMANLLGVNRITFIRTLKELKSLGLVDLTDKLYCISSIEKLEQYIKENDTYT